MKIRILRPGACLFIITLCIMLSACGGGSSGTGEADSSGMIVDPLCMPVEDVSLEDIGIDAVSETTDSNGSFTLAPSVGESIQLPTANMPTPVDVSEPTCILVSIMDNSVTAVLSYPKSELSSCTVEAVAQTFPSDLVGFCTMASAIESDTEM